MEFIITQDSFKPSELNKKKKRTLFLTRPGTYILKEDIIVGSSSMGDKGKFIDFDRQTGAPPFHLGLWAAISIMGKNIVLDLNGHTISMTTNFQRQQRFFSLIELASQPFPKGIAGFPKEPICAENVTIMGGTLCNTSHHCIHGNNNKDIIIENMVMKDFEVAAIAINNADNLIIREIDINGTSRDITVLSTYSTVVDLKTSLETVASTSNNKNSKIAKKYLKNEILEHLVKNPGKDKYGITSMPKTKDGQELPEGNAYGIYLSNKFTIKELSSSGEKNKNVTVQKVNIKNISTNPQEVIAICESSDKVLKDNKGNIIPWNWLFDEERKFITSNEDYHYSRRLLIKMQLFCNSVLKNEKSKFEKYMNIESAEKEEHPNVTSDDIGVTSQGGFDSRHHLLKGNIGLRIDGMTDSKLEHILIRDVKNYGDDASLDVDKKIYSEYADRLRIKNTYNGNFSTGLSLTYGCNIESNNLQVEDTYSRTGHGIAVSLNKGSNKCNFEKISIKPSKDSNKSVCLYHDSTSYNNKITIFKKDQPPATTKTYNGLFVLE